MPCCWPSNTAERTCTARLQRGAKSDVVTCVKWHNNCGVLMFCSPKNEKEIWFNGKPMFFSCWRGLASRQKAWVTLRNTQDIQKVVADSPGQNSGLPLSKRQGSQRVKSWKHELQIWPLPIWVKSFFVFPTGNATVTGSHLKQTRGDHSIWP